MYFKCFHCGARLDGLDYVVECLESGYASLEGSDRQPTDHNSNITDWNGDVEYMCGDCAEPIDLNNPRELILVTEEDEDDEEEDEDDDDDDEEEETRRMNNTSPEDSRYLDDGDPEKIPNHVRCKWDGTVVLLDKIDPREDIICPECHRKINKQ